jgi:hypothetical protein
MMRLIRKVNLLILISVLGFLLIAVQYGSGGEPPILLPKDRDSVFCLATGLHTEYLRFGKDGKYRCVTCRDIPGAFESDYGTWKQDAKGQIEVRSAVAYKDVRSGPLRVRGGDAERLRAFRPLAADIGRLLASDKRDSYGRKEIEGAWKYTYRCSFRKSETTASAVDVERGVEKVTRKQLGDLLEAWKAYLKDDAKDRFHLLMVKYRQFVLLASNDYPGMVNNETPEEARKSADLCGGKDGRPMLVFVLTDADEAPKETEIQLLPRLPGR